MMTPDSKVRVSILERIVPAFAFAVVAISGAIGGGMLLKLLSDLRQESAVGYAVVFGEFSKIEFAVGGVLVFAAALGAIGILISLVRLFTTNTTSSPNGGFFVLLGMLSLVPPFAFHYLMHGIKEAVLSPDPGAPGMSAMQGTIDAISYFAIGSAAVITLVLTAFSFIPFSSRPGRKVSPVLCLVLVQILIVGMAGIYIWQARESLIERDRPREDRFAAETSGPYADNSGLDTNSNYADNTYDAGAGSNSDPQGRAISGGILNDKAVELPQPEYPPLARRAEVEGTVSIQVTIDEKGNVIQATSAGGHPLLTAGAVKAARKAKFKPTKLNGQPVKVTGVITYNFSLQ